MDFLVRVQVLRKHALGIAGGLENLNLSCQIVKKNMDGICRLENNER